MSRGLGGLQRRVVSEMNLAIDEGAPFVRLRDLCARLLRRRTGDRLRKSGENVGRPRVLTIVSGTGLDGDLRRFFAEL